MVVLFSKFLSVIPGCQFFIGIILLIKIYWKNHCTWFMDSFPLFDDNL